MGFAAGELQVVFHPVLGGEEPEITKRLRDIEMIGHRDASGVGLAAELLDPFRPRHGGGLVEVGGIERFEHRQPLRAVLDRRSNPLRTHHTSVGADGDVDDRIKAAVIDQPDTSGTRHRTETRQAARRRLAHLRILDNGHGSIMTRGCHVVV